MITTGANSFEAMPATNLTSFRNDASPMGRARSCSCVVRVPLQAPSEKTAAPRVSRQY